MLPRSGPASMRCSVCRVDPGRFHRSNGPAPGTGLQSPETESQNRRYRDLSGRQRPHAPCLNPQKCPQTAGFSSETRKRRFVSECVVVDVAPIEPVSLPAFWGRLRSRLRGAPPSSPRRPSFRPSEDNGRTNQTNQTKKEGSARKPRRIGKDVILPNLTNLTKIGPLRRRHHIYGIIYGISWRHSAIMK
jgi:hypothetical protein